MKKTIRRVVVFGIMILLVLLLAWLITAAIQASGRKGASSSLSAAPSSASQPAASVADSSAASEGLSDSEWNYIGPVEQTINEMELVSPDYRMIALPENGRVDMSYFDTVTFVGDSITQGLELYKTQGIPNAHYCAYKSIGPKQIYDGSIQTRADGSQEIPLDALVASAPQNVYILLGTNAMVAMDDASLLAYYREMLNIVRQNLPEGTGIYIQSITPVRPDIDRLPMDRITGLNNALALMAWEEGVYFLDLNEALAGDDGYLREDFSGTDGYHMNPTGYSAWVEYLVTHTAYDPKNPYLEGSSFYQPTLPPEEQPAAEEPPAEPAAEEPPPEGEQPA